VNAVNTETAATTGGTNAKRSALTGWTGARRRVAQPGVLSHDELLVDAARNSPPAPLAAWLLPELRAMVAREAAGRHRVTHAGVTQSRALTSKVHTASDPSRLLPLCPGRLGEGGTPP
jgi:hypothetical protein